MNLRLATFGAALLATLTLSAQTVPAIKPVPLGQTPKTTESVEQKRNSDLVHENALLKLKLAVKTSELTNTYAQLSDAQTKLATVQGQQTAQMALAMMPETKKALGLDDSYEYDFKTDTFVKSATAPQKK